MFVLDTPLVSELTRPAPDSGVALWVPERAAVSLFLTAVTEAQFRFGLAVTPSGKHGDALARSLERMLEAGFADPAQPLGRAGWQ